MANDPIQFSPSRLSWDDLCAASDADLVRQVVAGHDDALAVIVDRYQRLVLSVALRIVKDHCEAEDIVQTVFVDIFKEVTRFDPSRGTLKVWLLQYAYGRSINRRRYLEHRQFYSQVDVEIVDAMKMTAEASGRDGLSPNEATRLVRQALGALTMRQQQAIELVYFEGLTLEEAAERTGDTVPAVRHQYYRGLMKLREFINSSRCSRQEDPLRAEGLNLGIQNAKPRPI